MAQLKSTVVQGSLRVTDTTYTTDLIISNTTAPTIATNDYLLLADNSDNNKILKGPALNTSNTTKWLTQAGTWTTPTATNVGLGNVTNDAQVKASLGTAKGDMLYWSASATPARLAIGTAGYTLQATANGPAWTQTVAVANGGTGKTSWTQWGVLYASASTTLANTGAGTAGYLLQSNATSAPSWIQATNSNTASTIVKRDSSGNFSAGTITALLTANRTTTGNYITLQSNGTQVGSLELTTRGTTSTEGKITLVLGNNKTNTTAENTNGKIQLYGAGNGSYAKTLTVEPELVYDVDINMTPTIPTDGGSFVLQNLLATDNLFTRGKLILGDGSNGVACLKQTVKGTSSVEGKAVLCLGNDSASNIAGNASGEIRLYHSNGGTSTISAGFNSIATTTKAVKIDTGLSVTGDIESTGGFVYVRSGSIWAGTTASTTAERDVGVRAGSGNLYLYAGAATTGNRGLFCTNAAGTSTQVITINQDNQISGIMNLAQNAAVQKAGASVSWIDGRTTAIAKTTSYSGYNGVISMKTTNGDWSLGVYTGDAAYLTYITDANYNARNNATTGQIAFESAGNIYASGIIVSKGPGERWCEAQNSTYGNRLCLDVNANGQIAGIWSSGYVNSSGTYVAGAKWLIYRNVNNATVIGDTVYISGNAYIGSSGSYYFSSGGELAVSGNVRSGNPISFLTTSNTAQVIKTNSIVCSPTYAVNSQGTGTIALNAADSGSRVFLMINGSVNSTIQANGYIITSSSREKKKNILPLKSFGEEIDKLNLVSFSYKWDLNDELAYGLIYEDTINILPYICYDNPTTIGKAISYEKLIPIMLKEIQDLRKRVKELELSKN